MKIPKGFTRVRTGSLIREGDYFISPSSGKRAKSSFVGFEVIPGSPIIRRIAKKAGGKRK